MMNTLSKLYTALFGLAALVVGHTAHAETFKEVIETRVSPILSAVIGLIMTLSVLAFMAGVIRFMYTAGDDKSRAEGKQLMVWGTFALFLMVTVWGVAGLIKRTFFG